MSDEIPSSSSSPSPSPQAATAEQASATAEPSASSSSPSSSDVPPTSDQGAAPHAGPTQQPPAEPPSSSSSAPSETVQPSPSPSASADQPPSEAPTAEAQSSSSSPAPFQTLDQAIADADAGQVVDMETALNTPPPPISDLPSPISGPTPLPRYKCHKEVNAFQIGAIDTGFVKPLLTPANPALEPVHVSPVWFQKHQPEVGGYYVLYDDAYASYSPRFAFESGYSPITDEAPPTPYDMAPTARNLQAGDKVTVSMPRMPAWAGMVVARYPFVGYTEYDVATDTGHVEKGIDGAFIYPAPDRSQTEHPAAL